VRFFAAKSLLSSYVRTTGAALPAWKGMHTQVAIAVGFGAVFQDRASRSDIYSILWAVVFGFATLNILNLAARKFEPTRRGMSFGELMAVLVVLLSVFLLGWEMLNMFHIFPIRLRQ
jgi:hypothetical protein